MATTAKKFVGVAIFDFSDDGLTALKWAHEYLKLPECKLGIILIKRVENQTPREKTDQPLDSWDIIEGSILSAEREDRAEKFQKYAGSFRKNIFAKIYEGEHIQETLQYAIDNLLGLDTLILGCAGADGQGCPDALWCSQR
ncbi:uncharacterized protein LOC133886180 isoform X2 [Phragmites australis]|uniref:uncharacterized protein LOC133886180 isoform X2 n=1 Tax=Phragmites australis TaxID=29695 RepID=UPI002D7941D7|nr:uncharacterized protein LOC133886180 isoform X2 [Phragmites australis]